MSTFLPRASGVSGVNLREVAPSIQEGTFVNLFAVGPDNAFFIGRGHLQTPTAALATWPLHTRSVMSWEIGLSGGDGGGSLEVQIASVIVAGVLQFRTWQIFGLYSEPILSDQLGYINGASGIELPNGMMARFALRTGDNVNALGAFGSLVLRGV